MGFFRELVLLYIALYRGVDFWHSGNFSTLNTPFSVFRIDFSPRPSPVTSEAVRVTQSTGLTQPKSPVCFAWSLSQAVPKDGVICGQASSAGQ